MEIARNVQAAPPDLYRDCETLIPLEIMITTTAIKQALWEYPADMERARALISKRMGLRICDGERSVKLKPPAAIDALA
jgi:hypothetical protein